MASEIERKFLAAAVPDELHLGQGQRLRQGYLAEEGAVEVRLRLSDDVARLTVKAAGLRRTEVEVDVEAAEAEDLWPHTEGRRIEKARFEVPLDGGAVAVVDRYEGALDGLVTVEVEFADEAGAAAFTPPEWFGPELTGDARWSNASLARHGRPR